MRSMLVASGLRMDRLGRGGEEGKKKEMRRTKETKIACMDYCFCVAFARQVIEGREPTSDIGNAEYSAMDCVYNLCLAVDLVRTG